MIFSAMQGGSEYYMTAGELKAMGPRAMGQQVKLGGRVEEGSVQWDKGTNLVNFSVTDGSQNLMVAYSGVVPDTFQPGADVILEGKMVAEGQFQATTMMAKCASKYEPAKQ
jgi:cytochrome c-type biogenesis protein CcmE